MTRFVQPSRYHAIGKIQKTVQLSGALIVLCYYPTLQLSFSTVFVLQHETYVPYGVIGWESEGVHAVCFLAGVVGREAARALQGKVLWIDGALMSGKEESVLGGLHGYKVADVGMNLLGKVVGVREQRYQSLLQVAGVGGRGLLWVPWHEDWVARVNHEEATIYIRLPKGYSDWIT